MITFKVGPTTKWAPIGGGSAEALVVFPLSTLLTERSTNVSVSTRNATWYTIDDNGLTDEFFGIES